MQFCIDQLDQIRCPETKKTYELIFRVFGLDIIIRELGFFLTQGVIGLIAAKNLAEVQNSLIKKLAELAPRIIESMNVPTHALYTPIAADYVKYNETPQYGEVVNAKL